MKKEIINEIILAVVLILLIIGFLDPFHYWMPGEFAMWLLFVVLVVFFIFAAFIWKEKANDEREELHLLRAGRWSWLVGSGFIMIGIVVQEIRHELDPWLVYALLAMIITKLASLIYLKNKL